MFSLQVVLFSIFVISAEAYNLYGPPKEATLSERPFQVAIFKNDIYHCSAALVSSKCVLTACSCIGDRILRLGETKRISDSFTLVTYTKFLRAKQINWGLGTNAFIVDGCNTQSNYNDAAILCSRDELVGSPVTIVKDRTMENVRGIVSGWSLTVEGQDMILNDLQRAYMKIISLEECRRQYLGIREVPDSALCAVAVDGVRGFCAGDFGAPLTHGEGLIGIAVSSFGCDGIYLPGIFTNVSRISDFIDSVVTDFEHDVELSEYEV